MIETFFASLLLGAVAGTMAGLFGIGGGLIIVPVLAILFAAEGIPADLIMIMSVATSLATIVFTSISSILAHHRLKTVQWDKVLELVPGIVIGAGIGTIIAEHVSGNLLRFLFILYLIGTGLQMALQIKPDLGQLPATAKLTHIASLLIGLLASLLGIGGGTLIVPFLVHFQVPMRNAVAIASACGLPIAIAGTIGYAINGQDVAQLPVWNFGYICVPSFLGITLTSIYTAPVGAKLAFRLPAQQLKRYFSLLLFAMAIKLISF